MKYNFNNQLIIHYGRNRFTDVYKRVIIKREDNKYTVISYYRENEINSIFKSRIYYSEQGIEELIDIYINEFNIKKRIEYK